MKHLSRRDILKGTFFGSMSLLTFDHLFGYQPSCRARFR